jgi:Protein of unknown function (DUF1566)
MHRHYVSRTSRRKIALPAIAGSVLFAACTASLAQTCVGRVQPSNPSAVYAVNESNGTVTDTRTGLIWDRCVLGRSGPNCAGGSEQMFTWTNGLATAAAANSNNYKGYADWRMPDIKELKSLVEHCRFSPAINEFVFPSSPQLVVWSSSPIHAGSGSAWSVDFGDGSVNDYARGNSVAVRLVRGGL